MSERDINTFAHFGQHFQEMLLKGLLTDAKWAAQIEEVIDVAYFDTKYLQYLAETYFDYSAKYKAYPSIKLLASIVRGELKEKHGSDEVLCGQIVDFLKRIKVDDNFTDLPYVKDKALDFCRRQAFVKALENAIPELANGDYAKIANDVRAASMVGTVASIGHDFFVDREARFNELNRVVVPTGFPELDAKDVLNGGLGAGEIGVIVAATGVGKSHFLVALGAEAMKRKKNVLHYTFELSDLKVGTRYDSYFCEIDSTDVVLNKDMVIKHYDENPLGKLVVKYYPTKSCNVQMLRSHIEKVVITCFVPDIILVDFADVMRSTRQYEQPRLEVTEVYEELRGLAGDLNLPLWTASQSNRAGSDSDFVDLTNMAESYGKAQTADVVLTMSRRPAEKSQGTGRLFVAKNRAGKDGMMYDLSIDTAQSRFGITSNARAPSDCAIEDEEEKKEKLRNAWKRLKKEPGLIVES